MINGIETEVRIIASTKENKLGSLNIFKNTNTCGSFRLIVLQTEKFA